MNKTTRTFVNNICDIEQKQPVKIIGIKSATGIFNNYQGCVRIYLDKSTGKVWANEFISGNSWINYNDDDIITILSKSTSSIWERDNKTSMKELRELALLEMK